MLICLFQKNETLFDELKVDEWLYQSGLPSNCPKIESKLIKDTDNLFTQWNQNKDIDFLYEKTQFFIPQQWIYFIQKLRHTSVDQLRKLDAKFNFKADPRLHIREEWFNNAVACEYADVYPNIKNFVLEIQKTYLIEAYLSKLIKTEEGLKFAREIAREGERIFHSRSRIALQKVMADLL